MRRRGKLSSFDPTWGVSGCLVGVYSDLGVTKDGSDRAGTWADQSGNGNDFTQATDSKKFVWYDSMLNGYPELRSDGIDDWMQTGAFTLARPVTMFLVYRDILHTGYPKDIMVDGLSDSFALQESGIIYGGVVAYGGHYWSTGEVFSNGSYTLITNGIASDGGNTGYVRKNTVSKAGFVQAISSSPNGLTLGCAYDFGRPTNIGFVAFLIYNSKLGDTDRAIIEAGLNARYAIW